MTDAEPKSLTDRAAFTLWAHDKLRYADTDRQGHVNNAVFATFLETGRVAFLYDPTAPLAPPGCEFVLARVGVDFRAELRWPGVVDFGSAIRAIGRSSVTIGQGLFVGAQCVATAESVVVLTDATTRRSTPMPEALRARLAALAPRS
ncbi:MAG: thioesterase family protein [Pseudomonadota bacterium]